MRTFRNTLLRWVRGVKDFGPTHLRASSDWRALYVAAVSETDKTRTLQRIADARRASELRAREIFQSMHSHLQEETAIDEALFALQALERSVLHLRAQAR